MNGTINVVNPKGIFDRTTKGRSLPPVTIQIERGRIRFFARVLGLTDPIHFDVTAARAKGHPDLVAPPSFFMAIDAAANEDRELRGESSAAAIVRCDYRRLLHGDETYEYLSPVFANDEVTVATKIVDFYDKKEGTMEFVTFVSTVEHAQRGTLIRATRNLLHRLS